MKLKSFIAATGLALGLSVASMASAVTLTFTTLPGSGKWNSTSSSDVQNSFIDWFDFTLPPAAQPAANGGSITTSYFTDVTFTSLNLYNLSDNPVPTYDYTTTFPSLVASGAGSGSVWKLDFFLPSGSDSLSDTYRIVAIGSGTGTSGYGSYAIHTQVTAVPEPETYAMLLIGLGLLGFTARRRKSSSNLA